MRVSVICHAERECHCSRGLLLGGVNCSSIISTSIFILPSVIVDTDKRTIIEAVRCLSSMREFARTIIPTTNAAARSHRHMDRPDRLHTLSRAEQILHACSFVWPATSWRLNRCVS